MRESVENVERARMALHDLRAQYEAQLPHLERRQRPSSGWVISTLDLKGRLDAAPYDPIVQDIRHRLVRLGGSSVAKVRKPAGRYKTSYVTSEHGRPLLSGTQALQYMPIALKFIAPSAFGNIADYELDAGWIIYPADGRADESLGTPAVVTAERDKWLGSGHVGRVIPNRNADLGWISVALSTAHAQAQLKSLASGSVVDSTFAWDMAEVILPPSLNIDFAPAKNAWLDFATAARLREDSLAMLDVGIRNL